MFELNEILGTSNQLEDQCYWSYQRTLDGIEFVTLIQPDMAASKAIGSATSSALKPTNGLNMKNIHTYYAINDDPELTAELDVAPMALTAFDAAFIKQIQHCHLEKIRHYAHSIVAATRFEKHVFVIKQVSGDIHLDRNLLTIEMGSDIYCLYIIEVEKALPQTDIQRNIISETTPPDSYLACCFLTNRSDRLFKLFKVYPMSGHALE